MKTLVTNVRGKCLFNVSMKTQVDGLISLYEKDHEEIYLDKFLKGGGIKIETDNPIKASLKISNIIKGAKKHGEVFVAYNGQGIGPLLGFIGNKEGVDGIFICYGDQALRIPVLKMDVSETRLKILEILSQENLTAIEISKKVDISRAMVYKHLNMLIELGLVKPSQLFGKYSITKTGKLVIV
ncbi:MAG: winged helix-turn-helix transcriptional regulator [Euryarchaeota archaeon]|nr:winged helix-turn-helix transcriptional regulator [Euryarchaeota archaeon]